MERKQVAAITQEEFEKYIDILRIENNNFRSHCYYCQKDINIDNIYSIFYKDHVQFCCDNLHCMESLKNESVL